MFSRSTWTICRQLSLSSTLGKGHSHWQNIAATKGKNDAARSKEISYLLKKAKEAVKHSGGFDMKLNKKLADVHKDYKSKSLPQDSFDKFLTRLKNTSDVTATYDVIGPSGSLFLIEVEAESYQKASSLLNKHLKSTGGFRMVNNSVSSQFIQKGVITVNASAGPSKTIEHMEELAIEMECEEVEDLGEGRFEFTCALENFSRTEKALTQKGFSVENAELQQHPLHPISLSEEDSSTVNKLFKVLGEDERIKQIYDNLEETKEPSPIRAAA
jgi:transcriptional/translational regulatory protein YebC/TACO1